MLKTWSEWQLFPDPAKGDSLIAPFGAGCYEMRLQSEKILFGVGGHLANRMTSLLPAPIGQGRRNNSAKRDFVLAHLGKIEYRTIAFATRREAVAYESQLRMGGGYRFST